MRRTVVLAAVVSLLLGLLAPAAAAAPYCGIYWGSLAKSAGVMRTSPIVGLRAGKHPCFDRLVVDLAGPAAGYRVRYVGTVRADGSGHPVPLRGGADLEIIVLAPAHDAAYRPTLRLADRDEAVRVSGFRTFRQVASAGTFEGQTTLGLGVRARLPFRVFTLPGPGSRSRLVIDVAHRW